jgi:hypothetical protein
VHEVRSLCSAKRAWGSLIVCCAAAAVSPAAASNVNPNNIPFGENESFLGNAGIGRATDTGAVYYNPSGLAEIGSGRIAVSGAVYLSFSTHYDALTRTDNTNVPFDFSGFNTIPSTYVATRRVGDWVGALSILVPSSLLLDDHASFTTPNAQGNLVYSLGESELWIGVSAARKIGERFSVGLTVFGIEHEQTSVIGADAQNVNTPTTVFATSLARESLRTFGLAATLGASYIAADWLRFGVRAQSALIQLYGNAKSYQVQRTVNGPTPTVGGEDVQGDANYAMPFDFGVGTALVPVEWLTLLVDASLQLGTSYSTFPASRFVNDTVTLSATPRLNVGVELKPAPAFPVRFGVYYDPSANGTRRGDPGFLKEDFFGLTAGVGFNDEHVRTSVGGFYVWSSGEATPGGAPGTTASVSSRGVGALLTTAYAF